MGTSEANTLETQAILKVKEVKRLRLLQEDCVAEKKVAEKKTASAGKKAAGKNEPFKIFKKRSGRFAVMSRATGKYLNGRDKLEVLINKGLVKAKLPAAPAAEGAAPAGN